ncbi:MAG: SH3 domain-containing protein [Anaerolineae bacterium]
MPKHRILIPTLFCLLLLTMLPIVAPVRAQGTSCPDAPAPRLILERESRVTPGAPLRMRQSPGLTGEIMVEVPAGALLTIIAGPLCHDSLNWWRVDWQGYAGWMVEGITGEYYLEPLSSPVTRIELKAGQPAVRVTAATATLTYNGALGSMVEADEAYPISVDTPLITQSFGAPYPSPGFYRFRFLDSSISAEQRAYNELLVYPAKSYESVNTDARTNLPLLRQLFQQRAPNPSAIPVLPFEFDQVQIVAAAQYLHFNGITGVRFLTYYGNDTASIRSDRLRYFFMGLSDDGKWFISAKFWITTPLLVNGSAIDPNFPNVADPNFAMLYAQYITDVGSRLTTALESDFAPSLTELDTLIQSLIVRIPGSQDVLSIPQHHT